MKIVIAADHRGFMSKNQLKSVSELSDIEFIDAGAFTYEEGDDFTQYARFAVDHMNSDMITQAVLLCGSGVGMCVMANKCKGVRCGIGITPEQVSSARREDDMNVLALATDYQNVDGMANLIRAFVDTKFNPLPRYVRRLDEIVRQEDQNKIA